MPTLNLDTAGTLDIIIAQGQSFTIEIDHFEADGTTPLPITGTVKMKISSPNGAIKSIDAVVASNKVTISHTDVQNTLAAGVYSHYIYADQAAGASLPLWKGKFTVNSYPS